MPIRIDIATPTRNWIGKDVDMAVVPSVDGDIAAMEQHAPVLMLLRGGIVSLYEGDQVTARLYVSGGFAEITGTTCAVLADEAIALDDIDRAEAERRLEEAQRGYNEVDIGDDAAVPAALERLQVAQSRVEAADAA